MRRLLIVVLSVFVAFGTAATCYGGGGNQPNGSGGPGY